jgi:hypothetical protein
MRGELLIKITLLYIKLKKSLFDNYIYYMKHLRTFSKFEINEGIFSSDFKSLSKSIKDKARSLLNFKKTNQPEMRIPE